MSCTFEEFQISVSNWCLYSHLWWCFFVLNHFRSLHIDTLPKVENLAKVNICWIFCQYFRDPSMAPGGHRSMPIEGCSKPYREGSPQVGLISVVYEVMKYEHFKISVTSVFDMSWTWYTHDTCQYVLNTPKPYQILKLKNFHIDVVSTFKKSIQIV